MRLVRLLKFLLSGEFLFAAFLLANVFKSALPSFFVDLNIILLGLTVFVAVKRLLLIPHIDKNSVAPALVFITFSLSVTVSLFYTPSTVYSTQKVLMLFSLTAWTFFGTFLLVNNRKSLEKFLKAFLWITLFTSIYVMVDYVLSPSIGTLARFGVDGENSLGLGRAAALGLIIIFMQFLFNGRVTKIGKTVSMMGLAVLVIVLFLTGARMALLSLFFALSVFLLIKTFKFTKNDIFINNRVVKFAFSLVPIPIFLIPFSDYFHVMFTRLSLLFNNSGTGSYTLRTQLYSIAFDMWKESPLFGKGLGSYPISFNGIDARYYPHNILLEILAELGLIGFLVFAVLLILPFVFSNVLKSNTLQICVLLMFIYTFLNANTTGDINDNRMMFSFLALLYMYQRFNDKNDDNLINM